MTISFKDKMLPTQPILSEFFAGSESELISSMYGAVMNYAGLSLPGSEFKIERSDRVSMEEMASSPMMLRLLQCLIQIHRPKRILEIGAFLGISAMYMAKALD